MNSIAVFLVLLACAHVPLSAQVYLTRDEALRLYFPDASIERKTLFLTDAQTEKIQAAARGKVSSRVIPYYVGKSGTTILGYAFLETHVVRTMQATFMVVVNPDSTIRAAELLAFFEPEDYRPPERWLETFRGKSLRSDLWLKRGIQNIVGATMTAHALTEGVRRILAIYELAVPKEDLVR